MLQPYVPAQHTGARARYAIILEIKKLLEQNGNDAGAVFKAYSAFYRTRTLWEYIEIARSLRSEGEQHGA
jgi:hypothetical protein